MFLSQHLKVYLHQRVITNQRTKKETMRTMEHSPTLSDEESEFSVSPHKAGPGYTDAGRVWSRGTWGPRALKCRQRHAIIRGNSAWYTKPRMTQITAQSLRQFAFSVLRLCWLNSHSSELSSGGTSSRKSSFNPEGIVPAQMISCFVHLLVLSLRKMGLCNHTAALNPEATTH